jgi:hypothetical protein
MKTTKPTTPATATVIKPRIPITTSTRKHLGKNQLVKSVADAEREVEGLHRGDAERDGTSINGEKDARATLI